MHVGPVGAMNDMKGDGSILEPASPFKPKDLDTWEQDSNTVLNTGPGSPINGMKQYPVGINNK